MEGYFCLCRKKKERKTFEKENISSFRGCHGRFIFFGLYFLWQNVLMVGTDSQSDCGTEHVLE